MNFTSTFTLTREHLEECYDQSLPYSKSRTPRYGFAGILICGGIGLYVFVENEGFPASILVGLGLLELISFYYRRPWWLTRQMWSRSANSEVVLTIDETGVLTKNPYTESTLLWSGIAEVIDTPKGILLVTESGGQSYLSKSVLSGDALVFIQEKVSES